DDLLWSIEPKTTAGARKRLVELVPSLLRSIDSDWSAEQDAGARREALLSCLFDNHVRSMKAVPGVAIPVAPAGAEALATAGAMAPVTAPAALPAPDEHEAQVQSLVRGDWCAFKSEGETVLARLAWRAPQRRRLLFTHRDGSTAFVHTPESLAAAFRSGRATLAIEAAPLFERAMTRLVASRSQPSEAAAAS